MIPKVIHYCWFGKNKKSRLIEKCIESWRKYAPDFEIREWNEENFDIDISPYVRQAYEQKKWAYISDYARFYILNKYGGIYLDTDVELIKPIDALLENDSFAGFSQPAIVATGLIFGCNKNNWLCAEVLKSYEGEVFDFSSPEKVLAIGRRVTAILTENGLKTDGTYQIINGTAIYPKEYFNPTDGDMHARIDSKAYSVHHYAATWFPAHKRILNTLRRFIGSKTMEKYYKVKHKIIK